MKPVAEEFPADRDGIGRSAGIDEVRQGAARAEVYELVGVGTDDPVGGLVAGVIGGEAERRALR